jgi:hypothetical protein
VRINGVAVPEIHLRQIARWCQQRIPEHARHQVRVQHTTRGSSVTIVEARAPWREESSPEWTRRRVAQLRHNDTGWSLYRPDRNSRWHLVDEVPTETAPGPLLEVIADPARAFWL